MNGPTPKKRARDLQPITGMPYQCAHRAVYNGTQRETSVRSGLDLNDFVTPASSGSGTSSTAPAHSTAPTTATGCRTRPSASASAVACTWPRSTTTTARPTDHHRRGQFFEQCIATEMYSNWAPPLSHLDGVTQAEYFWGTGGRREGRRATTQKADPSPWDLEWAANPSALTRDQVDLLRAILTVAGTPTARGRQPRSRRAPGRAGQGQPVGHPATLARHQPGR